ncbi:MULTISPECIES: hypothetical protein [Comamonas]|nr:hypothetical protein [Comamonas thiooxydans]
MKTLLRLLSLAPSERNWEIGQLVKEFQECKEIIVAQAIHIGAYWLSK